jgi:hypothetical protein
MKNQKLNKEFYRMQQLAGIINESSDLTANQIALNYSNTSPNTTPGATPGETPLKNKIREMILAELGNPDDKEAVYEDGELEEAKKDEEVEDVETTDTTEEEPEEDAPAEEAPATGGGLEDIAADMEGTEGDLMDHLMKALKVAKGMNNEKLETQIGNTLKFFVSEYIGGEEQ